MRSLARAMAYLRCFGARAFIGMLRDKCVTAPRRFRADVRRAAPVFAPPPEAGAPADAPSPARPLNILYLTHCFYPAFRGGTERFVYNLASAQIKRGNHARVLTLTLERPGEGTRVSRNVRCRDYAWAGVPVTEAAFLRAAPGLFYKRLSPEDADMSALAAYVLGRERFDIVHAAYPQPFAAFLRVCAQRRLPYLVTITDFTLSCHYATMVDDAGRFCAGCRQGAQCAKACPSYAIRDYAARYEAARALLQGAACLTAPSRFVAGVMAHEFPGTVTRVIPHGVSPAFARGAHRQTKRFAYIGALSDQKGVHLLLSAFRALPGDIALDIYGAGAGNYVARLKRLADGRVRFHGAVAAEKMPAVYQAADCVIVSSMWYETYNFVLREALQSGCLVIASDIGALPESVTPGRNGFLFPAGDKAALLACLQSALDFDWSRYLPFTAPAPAQEAEAYTALYAGALSALCAPAAYGAPTPR